MAQEFVCTTIEYKKPIFQDPIILFTVYSNSFTFIRSGQHDRMETTARCTACGSDGTAIPALRVLVGSCRLLWNILDDDLTTQQRRDGNCEPSTPYL